MSFAHSHSIFNYRFQPSQHPVAETIMLLHGNGFNSSFWGEMAVRLNERFHLLFMDLLPGHAGEMSWELLCDELHAVLEKLAIEELHIVGHSFGGSLAVAYANRHPDRVKKLVLLSLAVFYPMVEGEQIVHNFLRHIEQEGVPAVARREFIPFLTLLPEGHVTLEALYQAYDQLEPQHYIRLFKLQMLARPIHERHQISTPTLLLAGERDKLYLPQLQSITAGYFTRGSFLIVPQAANALFIDQPQLTAQWIRDFLLQASDEEPPLASRTMSSHIPSLIYSVMHAAAPITTPPKPVERREPSLSLSLFHAFHVRLNGIEIVDGWDKRYAKNILAYLAMHPVCTREELCDALFPGLNRSAALNNLRVYVGHLKKLLELPEGESILMTDRKYIRLKAVIDCDLQCYDEEIKRILFIKGEEAKCAAARDFLQRLGDASIMTGIYDQWFLDYRSYFEELIVSLSQWAASWEARMNRPDSALFFEKIAGRLLDDPM
ncbi:alpha/beta fold hydrolase [Paenibacillus rhizovicinus]|uniref:Alpha/beta fold hydrolase n=1 Tax=Paenibacillus rhizovicinus TaxID=2704463 RepID=A0A6C0P4U9_9BACL|nr:alpha/beta hydrolase [Paenibacillus rhizovicinus]QHW33361.1 alpha/beta fold hydrolase [Paenibacillus rhizovicinus]